jgi:glycolate oxidase
MLKDHIAREIRDIVGEDSYLDSPEDLRNYAYDAYVPEFIPDVVVLPSSTSQVQSVVEVARREGIPVTPRGAGTNISGGAVPRRGGLVMCLTRMNRILEIDPRDRLAVVEPGVINADFQREVRALGMFYPPDPASMNVCTLGGNVAENAGGPLGVKYGVTRDYLLGLEVVLPSGRTMRTGGRTMKNVTGYDLTSLMCGSEGTLGVITQITVRLLPIPGSRRSIQAAFSDLEAAGQAVADIMAAGILPAALELMDSRVINIIEQARSIGLPTEAEGLLLIMVDGTDSTVREDVKRIEGFLRAQGAYEIRHSQSVEEEDELWEARRSAFGVMASARPNCIVEDVTVPISRLPSMVRSILSIAHRHEVTIGVLAHAGDGNMHPLILTDRRDEDEWGRVELAIDEIFKKALELGGTLSGEHGIGLAKNRYLDLALDQEAIKVMNSIKGLLDPKDIMNPGKFPSMDPV